MKNDRKTFIRVSLSQKIYGGNFYETSLDPIFENMKDVSYSVLQAHFGFQGILRILEIPFFLARLTFLCFSNSTVINNYISIPLMPFLRNGITIIHHIDSSASPFLSRQYQNIAELILKYLYSRSNHIVVESKYWENIIRDLGFKKVSVIYVGLPIERYMAITEGQIEKFKLEHGLQNCTQPIVYIGNPQTGKGYDIVYNELRNEGYVLVTSGLGKAKFDHPHFFLDFTEYLCLLSASSCVVTYSQFKEGWCIVAHEGALCGTPVVGSGSGGMRELLETTGQTVCESRGELKRIVRESVSKKKTALPQGQQYSMERFIQSWQTLIQSIQREIS
jgi:glycosyltransferase involved in cell wall biosynthesis